MIHLTQTQHDELLFASAERDELRAQELERLRAQEPVAWHVYVPDAKNGYVVDNLDDHQLVDDMTNTNNVEVTPLYAVPPVQPAQRPTDEQITADMIDTWRINYGLDKRTPADAMRWWHDENNGMAPAGAVAALGLCLLEIERLRAAPKD